MKPLALAHPWRARIASHARARAPEECCGILLGHQTRWRHLVVRSVRASNVATRDRRRSYSVAPRALLAAHKAARHQGLSVLGYYHSHPEDPPVPSATDRDHALRGVTYLILGSEAGTLNALRAWWFDGSDFFEQPIVENESTSINP